MSESYLEELRRKIKASATCSNLFALENKFNQVGLTVQTTSKNRVILCKIKDGKPYCENVIDDYMFIGSTDGVEVMLTERVVDCIVDFVDNAYSEPAVLEDKPRSWQKHTSLYGNVVLVNEDVNAMSQEIL